VRGFLTGGGYGGAEPEEKVGTYIFLTAVSLKYRLVLQSFDVVVAATDVPGIQRLLPQSFRDSFKEFDNIYKLSAVPVVTVQLR
jgi:zeta-carotene desaturase